MNWYKQAIDVFRGDTVPLKIQDFNVEHGTKQLGKELSSSFAQGPGMYFTTTEEDASHYGKNIIRAKINNANIVSVHSKPFSAAQINSILSGVNRERLDLAVSNWDENYNVGKRMLIDSIAKEIDPLGQLMLIWSDVFYHQNPNEFISLMVANKIDGISVEQRGATHYIIYNRNILV